MALTFGKVPHPAAQEKWVLDIENTAWDDLGPRTVKGVVWHRMIGSLAGTNIFFRGMSAAQWTKEGGLTDYGVGVGGFDIDSLDGVIYRWNDPLGHTHTGVSADRAGWASGVVNAPYGDGLAFLNDYGYDLNIVNRDQASIEISGNYDTPLTAKSKSAVAHLTAYWADQAKIPWDAFPIIPGKGYSFVRWHQEFTIGTGKVCPGQVVMDATPVLIEMVRAILKKYQEPTMTYAKPGAFPAPDGTDNSLDGHLFRAIRRRVKVKAATLKRLRYADPLSPEAAAPLVQGNSFIAIYVVAGSGGKQYWVDENGYRIPMDGTTPKVVFVD